MDNSVDTKTVYSIVPCLTDLDVTSVDAVDRMSRLGQVEVVDDAIDVIA